MDVQGADRARPYVEVAGATFTAAVDEGNLLGQLYGFKAIPNGFLIDREGVVRYKRLGSFDIRRAETASILEKWTAGLDLSEQTPPADTSAVAERSEASDLFRKGQALYHQGRVNEAVVLWRRGLALDPGNYIIRKQIWAVESPERFYAGEVDYDWQREQTAKGL